MSKPKKTPDDEIQLGKMGTNLGILQIKIREKLIPLRGQKKFSDRAFGQPFGKSISANSMKCAAARTK